MFELLGSIVYWLGNWAWPIVIGIDKSRLMEGFIFLFVCWIKVKPHLEKIEARMGGIETNMGNVSAKVEAGFKSGESRFSQIEKDVAELKKRIEPEAQHNNKVQGGQYEQTV